MGRIVRDPKNSDPYLAALRYIPVGSVNPRLLYLRQVAEDYDVALSRVVRLSVQLGKDEDFDALLTWVDAISDPSK